MKKLILFLMCVLCFSCSHELSYDNTEFVTNKYNTSFVQSFGQPAPTQTWGFTSKAVTRSVIKENHELPDGYVKPTLESGEAEYVMNWFRNNEGEASVGKNWDKFFIVYVGGNNNVQIWSSWNNSTQNGNVTLDYLEINGEHINDWNANGGPTVYVYNNTPNNFTCHNSYCNLTTSKWKLAEITYNGKVGYYVGLSAYGKKKETTEKYQLTDYGRENFYDDWVFKIVPANVTPPSDKLCIIGEDLSVENSTDFDFNDVVFDVNITSNGAECLLKAAGGTLPLTIQDKEIHALFGVETDVMVNTGIVSKPYVPFTLPGITDAKDIIIKVNKDGNWIELTANQGKPAAKIAVRQDFEWCSERQPITSKYPNFKNWVQGIDYVWY